MRRKDEATRSAILASALRQFTKHGYERASMDAVAEEAGCTKATVYNYFPAKEALLLEAMRCYARQVADGAFTSLGKTADTEKALMQLATAYLTFQLTPAMVDLLRLAMAEGKRGDLGRTVHEEGIRAYWSRVAVFLADRIAANRLPPDGVWRAAMHLKALLDGDALTRALLSITEPFTPSEIRRLAKSGC